MALLLELATGSECGASVVLQPGDIVRVGSAWDQEFMVLGDQSIRPNHFAITALSEKEALVTARGGVVFASATPIQSAVIGHLDWIQAGKSLFRIWEEGQPLNGTSETVADELVLFFQDLDDLLLLVDAAWDSSLQEFIETGEIAAQAIFEDRSGQASNPWLARVTSDTQTLDFLLRRFWGKGRLIFFQSPHSFDSIKEFFAAKGLDDSRRWFDSRVLREILGSSGQAAFEAGPVARYWLEDRRPSSLLSFRLLDGRAAVEPIQFSRQGWRPIPSSAEIAIHVQRHGSSPLALLRALYDPASTAEQAGRFEESVRTAGDCGLGSEASRLLFGMLTLRFDAATELEPQLKACPIPADRFLDRFVTDYNLESQG